MSLTSRGRVYWATIDGRRKPWLVVSNNARNVQLPSCLGVRITTSDKPQLASIVRLSVEDAPLLGSVMCDDIAVLFPDDDQFEYFSAVTPATMIRVEAGVKAALALR